MTLIAEDLLLLVIDDGGKVSSAAGTDLALAGSVLLELGLLGAVTASGPQGFWQTTKVSAVPDVELADPLLKQHYLTIAARERSAQDLVSHLGKGLRWALLDRLVRGGLLTYEENKVLGVVTTKRFPATDTRHRDSVRNAIGGVLTGKTMPDERTAGLIAVLHAADLLHTVISIPGWSTSQLKARGKVIAESNWASKAVSETLQGIYTALLTVFTAAVVVNTTTN